MATIDRVSGFAFRIYPNDHGPPHVHVVRAGASAIIEIGDDVRVRVVYGLKFGDLKRAITIVQGRRERYLLEWRRIHGEGERG